MRPILSFEETHMVEKATENAYNYGVGVRNGFHADSPAVTFLHYTYKHEWKKKISSKSHQSERHDLYLPQPNAPKRLNEQHKQHMCGILFSLLYYAPYKLLVFRSRLVIQHVAIPIFNAYDFSKLIVVTAKLRYHFTVKIVSKSRVCPHLNCNIYSNNYNFLILMWNHSNHIGCLSIWMKPFE